MDALKRIFFEKDTLIGVGCPTKAASSIAPVDRRREDRIRKLCSELLAQPDTRTVQELSAELRSELRTYVEELRKQFAVYPGVQHILNSNAT
jgi:hypothetical protein